MADVDQAEPRQLPHHELRQVRRSRGNHLLPFPQTLSEGLRRPKRGKFSRQRSKMRSLAALPHNAK